jgi:hypothetical protein
VKKAAIIGLNIYEYTVFSLLFGIRYGTRNSAINITTAAGYTAERSQFESRERRDFSFLHVVQTDSGLIESPIRWVTGDLSQGLKRLGREADDSPPITAEVKNTWVYTFTHMPSWSNVN